MSLLFRRRQAEMLAGGGKFSATHSLRVYYSGFCYLLLVVLKHFLCKHSGFSVQFAGEWLDRRSSPIKPEWCLAVDTAVRERAAAGVRLGKRLPPKGARVGRKF
jgi:hypothetical protein